jgi:NAD(P)-dependent dehydrogenase (short-subunit alcohol dehydrogenase family)
MTNMNNPFSLSEKKILITGASSGIGKATAIECSKMGATIIITGRNQERLNQTYQQLSGKGHSQYVADLCLEDDLNMLSMNIPEINGLVNAAGIVKTLPFQFINREDLSSIFDINFMAPVLLTQKLVKAKKLDKESSIVYISSIDGPVIAHVGNSMYAASKGALSAMVRTMALDLATKKIRVNSIFPGMIDTPLIHQDDITEEQLSQELKKYPLRRYGEPEEIAYGAIYLLSEASKWVTGTNLIIDGGFTLI